MASEIRLKRNGNVKLRTSYSCVYVVLYVRLRQISDDTYTSETNKNDTLFPSYIYGVSES